jgi:chaperonin GroES
VINDSGLEPVEYNVVVKMDAVAEKTAGGIFLPPAAKDKDELATDEGTLVAVSPHAFTYVEDWPEGSMPRPGDRVMFAQYAGRIHEFQGRKYRVLKDKDIIAVIAQPKAVAQAA